MDNGQRKPHEARRIGRDDTRSSCDIIISKISGKFLGDSDDDDYSSSEDVIETKDNDDFEMFRTTSKIEKIRVEYKKIIRLSMFTSKTKRYSLIERVPLELEIINASSVNKKGQT